MTAIALPKLFAIILLLAGVGALALGLLPGGLAPPGGGGRRRWRRRRLPTTMPTTTG